MSKALLHLGHKNKTRSNNPDEIMYDAYLHELKKEYPNTKPYTKKQVDEAYDRIEDIHNLEWNIPRLDKEVAEKIKSKYPNIFKKNDDLYDIKRYTYGELEEKGLTENNVLDIQKLLNYAEDQEIEKNRLRNSIYHEGQQRTHYNILRNVFDKVKEKPKEQYMGNYKPSYIKKGVNIRNEHGFIRQHHRPIREI
jgi:hypothetical protein